MKEPVDVVPEVPRTLEDEHVARVFKTLADEHCAKRAVLERDLIWKTIAGRARSPRGGGWFARFALPAAAALCVVCAVVGWTYRPGLEYEVTGAVSVSDGEIRAGAAGASLVFSDGSTVNARSDSVLSLSIVGQRAALTRLLRGAISVSVRHDDRADWRFLAGPYEVRVVGTRFDLSWDPDVSLLNLVMHEGSVRVTGPGKFDQTLAAGETLKRSSLEQDRRIARSGGTAELRTSARPLDVTLPTAASATTVRSARPAPAAPSAPRPAELEILEALPVAVPPEDDWPELVSRGRFAEVVEAAEREGVEGTLSKHEVADLKALAQAARYTGKTPLALRAWTGIRDRFQGHPAALQAAFFLGRIYDELDQPGPARKWLDTYLAEAPSGVYASEALGREFGLAKRLGQHADAQRLARRYLEVFPSGAYARNARALLSKHATP